MALAPCFWGGQGGWGCRPPGRGPFGMPGAGPAAPHVCRLPLPPPAPGGSRHFPSGLRGGGSQVDTATLQPPARPSQTGSGCWTGSRVPGARGQARAADGAPPGLGLQTSGSDPSVSHDVRGAGGGQEFFFFNETKEKRKKSVRVHAGTWSFRGPLFSTFLGRPRASPTAPEPPGGHVSGETASGSD